MIEFIIIFLLILVSLIAIILYIRNEQLEEKLAELSYDKRSQSVRYGLIAEQWLPFSKEFPFDPANFRFLGSPIDGIAFCEDRIYFCEFKFADSKLSDKERKIKKLVQDKKIEWCEVNAK
ncbi:MAG: endonuclease [Candidatus Diapherotrites archaeon]|nr:endonuclease [Candidatus Diapherotrites archaeon]